MIRLGPVATGPYSRQHTIMQHETVPQSGKRVQARERKECIGQIPVNVLGGFKYRGVFLDPEIEVKKAELENAAMVNEGHETDDRDDEHQHIERPVHRD